MPTNNRDAIVTVTVVFMAMLMFYFKSDNQNADDAMSEIIFFVLGSFYGQSKH